MGYALRAANIVQLGDVDALAAAASGVTLRLGPRGAAGSAARTAQGHGITSRSAGSAEEPAGRPCQRGVYLRPDECLTRGREQGPSHAPVLDTSSRRGARERLSRICFLFGIHRRPRPILSTRIDRAGPCTKFQPVRCFGGKRSLTGSTDSVSRNIPGLSIGVHQTHAAPVRAVAHICCLRRGCSALHGDSPWGMSRRTLPYPHKLRR